MEAEAVGLAGVGSGGSPVAWLAPCLSFSCWSRASGSTKAGAAAVSGAAVGLFVPSLKCVMTEPRNLRGKGGGPRLTIVMQGAVMLSRALAWRG